MQFVGLAIAPQLRQCYKGAKIMITHCNSISYGSLASPLGTIYVALDGEKVIALSFTSGNQERFLRELGARTSQSVRHSDAAVRPIVTELLEYFKGKRKEFSFSCDLSGHTDFQQRVLNAAASIPFGQTRTYRWLAERAKSPDAFRAAGQVMAHNPVPIIIPCHRVIGSSGGLCGFAGGLRAFDLKRKLLEIEGVNLS
ncbi:methylated-DNA--[protein]-cysteine S-methyltransferase [Candidatus Poribacteria bacterium]|nr:methylated-DNA--[protein]-cysteine S-methyltransferase [Candidatus Poribacteria bacterium]